MSFFQALLGLGLGLGGGGRGGSLTFLLPFAPRHAVFDNFVCFFVRLFFCKTYLLYAPGARG